MKENTRKKKMKYEIYIYIYTQMKKVRKQESDKENGG